MEGKSLLKSRRVFRAWFFSYVSVLLVPIFIVGSIYSIYQKMMIEEIGKANMSLLRQVQTIMDARISEVEDLGMQIALNPRVNTVVNIKGEILPKDRLNLYKVAEDFKVYKASGKFIDDCFLYINNTETAIGPGTHKHDRMLYDFYFSSMGLDYQQWKEEIKRTHRRTIKPIIKKAVNNTPYNALIYMQSIPVMDSNNSLGTIIITIDEARLIEIVRNASWLEQGAVFILNENDEIIMSSKSVSLPEQVKYEDLEDDNIFEYVDADGKKIAISSIDSEIMPWKYITIIPSNIFWQKAQNLQKLIWFGIFICIIVGAIVAYAFTRLNYNPIDKMVETFAYREDSKKNGSYNEYKYIQEAINSTLQEQREMENKLYQQNKVLKTNFLLRLLKGELQDEFLEEREFPAYDVSFSGESFVVVLFYLDNYGDSFELSQFILQNIFEELMNEEFNAYGLEVDEMVACIINGEDEGHEEALYSIETAINKCKTILDEWFNISIMVSISNVHDSLIGISDAYEEAFNAMEYKMVLDFEDSIDIIHYNHIQNPKRRYLYSMEMEQRLINKIKVGDSHGSKELLNNVFEDHYNSTDHTSIEMIRCLMFDLLSTIIKAIDSSDSEIFLEELKPVERIMKAYNLQEMKQELHSILDEVCNFIRNQRKEDKGQLENQVKNYVLQHFDDVNLNVAMLGEKFNITPAYLSKLFKDQTGISLLEFINSTRVRRSKELLKEDKLTVAEISEMVGYANSNAFIRVFKKYEGITPGKYKTIV